MREAILKLLAATGFALALAGGAFGQANDQQTRDAVNTAVDLVAAAGSVAGVSVGDPEKTVIKALVTCAVTGKKIANCAREAVVDKLPREAQPMARCILEDKPPLTCATETAVALLPLETREIAGCVLQGRPVKSCIEQEAVKRLPEQTRAVASCVLDGTAVATCAGREVIKRLPQEVQQIANCVGSGQRLDQCATTEAIKRMPPEAQNVVRCVGGGSNIADCATAQAVQTLPADAQAIANCARSTGSVEQCAANAAISKLPKDTQAIAACVERTRGNVETCAGQEFLNRLPQGVQATASCISDRHDLGRCAAQAPIGSPQKPVLDLIDKLKADGRSELGANDSGAIRNIIMIADGIKNEDYEQVLLGGGTEILKLAGKIILKALLPPLMPLGFAVDPIVDIIIQSKADVVIRLINAAKAGDEGEVGAIIAEAYLSQGFILPCSLPIIPEAVRVAVCGPIGKVIREIAGVVGDVVDLAVDIIEDPLDAPSALWGASSDLVANTIGGKNSNCVKPEVYYQSNYARCLPTGVTTQIVQPASFDNFIQQLNLRCRKYYDSCFTSSHFDSLCNPQKDRFRSDVEKLGAGIDQAASVFVQGFPGHIREVIEPMARLERQTTACGAPDFTEREAEAFVIDCRTALRRQLPIQLDGCPTDQMSIAPPDPIDKACRAALDRIDPKQIVTQQCNAAAEPGFKVQHLPPIRPIFAVPSTGDRPSINVGRLPISSFRPGGTILPSAPPSPHVPQFAPITRLKIAPPPDSDVSTPNPSLGSGGSNLIQPSGDNQLPQAQPVQATRFCPLTRERVPAGMDCPPFRGPGRPDGILGAKVCPDGTVVRSFQNCPASAGASVDVCPPGKIKINGVCRNGGVVGPKICPDGTLVRQGQNCRVVPIKAQDKPVAVGPSPTKMCPDGTRVPATATCPNQTKSCPNGSRVPITAECPRATPPKPLPPKPAPPKPVPPKPAKPVCTTERICVAFGKGAPGTLGRPCLRYQSSQRCGSQGGPR